MVIHIGMDGTQLANCCLLFFLISSFILFIWLHLAQLQHQGSSLWDSGFSLLGVLGLSCPHDMWDLSSLTGNQTHIPCISRGIFNPWTTGEVPCSYSLFSTWENRPENTGWMGLCCLLSSARLVGIPGGSVVKNPPAMQDTRV